MTRRQEIEKRIAEIEGKRGLIRETYQKNDQAYSDARLVNYTKTELVTKEYLPRQSMYISVYALGDFNDEAVQLKIGLGNPETGSAYNFEITASFNSKGILSQYRIPALGAKGNDQLFELAEISNKIRQVNDVVLNNSQFHRDMKNCITSFVEAEFVKAPVEESIMDLDHEFVSLKKELQVLDLNLEPGRILEFAHKNTHSRGQVIKSWAPVRVLKVTSKQLVLTYDLKDSDNEAYSFKRNITPDLIENLRVAAN